MMEGLLTLRRIVHDHILVTILVLQR